MLSPQPAVNASLMVRTRCPGDSRPRSFARSPTGDDADRYRRIAVRRGRRLARRQGLRRRLDDPAGIAVDGKTLRGSRSADTAARHVMTACDQATSVVLASIDVDGKTNESPCAEHTLPGPWVRPARCCRAAAGNPPVRAGTVDLEGESRVGIECLAELAGVPLGLGHPAQHRGQPSPPGRRHLDRTSLTPKRPRSVTIPTTPWTHLKRSNLDLATALGSRPGYCHNSLILSCRCRCPSAGRAVLRRWGRPATSRRIGGSCNFVCWGRWNCGRQTSGLTSAR